MESYPKGKSVLAIVDGRFLPVKEFELGVESQRRQLSSKSRTLSDTSNKGSTILQITTSRDPKIRNKSSNIYLFCGDTKQLIKDCVPTSTEIDLEFGKSWTIEFMGTVVKEYDL